MRPSLLLIASLSTLVLAQNVLAIAPVETDVSELEQMSTAGVQVGSTLIDQLPGNASESPRAGTMGLLAAGLAGLTAAGGRREERASA